MGRQYSSLIEEDIIELQRTIVDMWDALPLPVKLEISKMGFGIEKMNQVVGW